MENETITPEALPDEGGAGAGSGVTTVKDLLSQTLGKDFPSDEAALKAVKDTFSYVGKAGQEKAELEKQLAELKTQVGLGADINKKISGLEKQVKDAGFYMEHPELKPYANLINKFGDDPATVIQQEDFKEVITKLQEHAKTEQSKSVLQSNPRLGQVKDKISEAKEAASKGNSVEANEKAVSAVIDAYELGG
jgi:hypothetical protein